MEKPRIIIADTDLSYLIPLQLKFAEVFFEKAEIELISEKEYFDEFFSAPQKARLLIVSEELYNEGLRFQNIAGIFLMTEQKDGGKTEELNIERIYKYASIKEIFNEIIRKSGDVLSPCEEKKRECQIIYICSASGGSGKTTLALGISAYLSKFKGKVLYISAATLQSFRYFLENQMPVSSFEVYENLSRPEEDAYNAVRHVIRTEGFSYLPPFKASLMSLGLDFDVFANIAKGAKQSGDYDFVIMDGDSVFDEKRAKLIDLADKVVLLFKQDKAGVFAAGLFAENISDIKNEKYIFICNDFRSDEATFVKNSAFEVSEYVEHTEGLNRMNLKEISSLSGIRRAAMLFT